jgi:hypothetical protein
MTRIFKNVTPIKVLKAKAGMIALFLVLQFFSFSCVITNEDENFVNVPKVADPRFIAKLTYSLNGISFYPLTKDTLWLDPNEHIQFRFSNGHVYGSDVKIDGNTTLEKEDDSDIYINGKDLTAGRHELQITQFVKSGTGSLADKLGAEYAGFSSQFILMLEPVNFTPRILDIAVQDGTLKIKWNAYNRSDFQSYEIRKYESYSGAYDRYRELVITDQTQTSMNDTTYVGGRVIYVITVNRGGDYLLSNDYMFNYNYDAKMELTKLESGQARLSWIRAPFYKNVRSMKVSIGSYAPPVAVDNIQPDQTFVDLQFDAVFGSLYEFYLTLNAKVDKASFYFDHVSVWKKLTYGKRIPVFSDIEYSEAEDAYYVSANSNYSDDPPGIYRLDTGLNVTDTILYDVPDGDANLVCSPDGRYLYLLNSFLASKIEKNPFRISEAYNAGDYFNDASMGEGFAVTNNNLLLYHQRDYVNLLYYTSKELLLNVESRGDLHITADGKYVCNGPDLYKFNGAAYQLQGTLPYENIRFLRFLNSTTQILIATPDKTILYDYVNNVSISEFAFSTPENNYAGFNEATMTYYIRFSLNPGLVLLNIKSGEQKTLEVFNVHDTKLEGDYLFTKAGFGIKY